ncbi:helix-turn-helix domain-containing protein [Rossellomorea vietnamensis]|uniref:helix-turn-helix domain-containing protein n=1 Tax=Rossellomorea vietnamensis TaxID=218284 RepID=UPI000690BA41|nr:transcriptional regulator [Rossellomorea vietnamensis]
MNPEEFGLFLRQLRKERDMTVRRLAELSNVSQSYITNLENNKRGIPSPDVLKKLSGPLQLKYSELMYRAGHLTEEEFEVYRKIEARSEALDERLKKVIDILSTDGKFNSEVIRDLLPIFNNEFFSGYQFNYVFIFEDTVKKLEVNPEYDISEILEEFQQYFNTIDVNNYLLKYASDNVKEEIVKELEKIAVKHNLLESNTHDLVEFLKKENLSYRDHPINDYHLKLINAYLEALFSEKT